VYDQARYLAAMGVETARIGEAQDASHPRRAELDILTARFAQRVYGRAVLPASVAWRLGGSGPEAVVGVGVYDASLSPAAAVLDLELPPSWKVGTMVQPRPLDAYRPEPASARVSASPQIPAADGATPQVMRWRLAESSVMREVAIPVVSVRQGVDGTALKLDGLLDDWQPGDAVHRGPLTRMIDRDTVTTGRLQPDDRDTWLAVRQQTDGVAIAFRTSSPSRQMPQDAVVSNTVNRDASGRVWGEDAITMDLRAVDESGMAGRSLRLVCKPLGIIVQRQDAAGKWVAAGQAEVAYASRPNRAAGAAGSWQGELLIPAGLLNDIAPSITAAQASPRRVDALAANFSRHYAETGFTATFAGPVDSEDDDSVTGLIVFDRP
jgi:hypothetical protein